MVLQSSVIGLYCHANGEPSKLLSQLLIESWEKPEYEPLDIPFIRRYIRIIIALGGPSQPLGSGRGLPRSARGEE